MTRLIGLAGALLLLAGCSATNISDLARANAAIIDAMGKDPATVCATVVYGPASIQLARTNIVNGDVTCNGNGLAVKSQATQVGVPISVIPQVSVGAPALLK